MSTFDWKQTNKQKNPESKMLDIIKLEALEFYLEWLSFVVKVLRLSWLNFTECDNYYTKPQKEKCSLVFQTFSVTSY